MAKSMGSHREVRRNNAPSTHPLKKAGNLAPIVNIAHLRNG
jgi:hypothetical protein